MISFFESLLPAELIRAFALTLFHSLWQGALLAILVAGLILLLRKYKPAVRYAVLYLMLVLIPVLFVATFMMIFDPETLPDNEKSSFITNNLQADENQAGEGLAVIKSDTAKTLYLSIVRFFESNARLFVLIWMTGFFLFLIRFTGSIFYVYRLKNYNIRQVDEHWILNLRRLSERLGLNKTVKLAESGLAKVPMTIGYLKPVILLPIGTLSGVPPQQIDAILLHELAHILRKDYLLNIIQSVIELLFFYHPLTWWLSGLIRQEREHICDDLAVEINQDHINYIKALTTMEELNSRSPLLANAMTGSKKKLLMRVKRLLTPAKIRKGSAEGIIGFLLLIGLLFALSFNALSTIPSSFDLSGRESGERIYNFIPFSPEIPDTIKATSSSGKVKISVYTDSTSVDQQESLQKMAESIDKQVKHYDQAVKQYTVAVEYADDLKKRCEEQQKVIIISKSDSAGSECDSVIVFYNDNRMPRYGNHYEYRVRPHYRNDMKWAEMEEFEWQEDELQDILKDQQLDQMELQLSEDELQERMKDIQIEMEMEIPEGDFENMEFYFNEPVNPPMPPEHRVPQSEKIIRQELRDDGLTDRGRKYVIELDSKAMYINGEKQPKEVYKKYRKLVDSLENIPFEEGDTFKLIF
jgi:beta-lactamase regulating signal transducer with metallopeptidase domain